MTRMLGIRCDGDEAVGAGHVARCLPVARAFEQLGWHVRFEGSYAGLGEWLLGPAERGPVAGADAVLVDSYTVPPAEICAIQAPVATLAEANRCPQTGVWIDYHLDRSAMSATDRLLPGPKFAPIDPRFAGAGRAGDEVRTVLVTVGGSEAVRAVIPSLVESARETFPDAEILLASGTEVPGTTRLPFPSSLLDVIGQVDVAVTGAGLTAYELAAAGVPAVLVPLAANQDRVAAGCLAAGVAVKGIRELADPLVRTSVSRRGQTMFDGRGPARIALALTARWSLAGTRPAGEDLTES